MMKKRFFDLAKKLSVKSDHAKHKLGCVIVNKNKVIGVGFNKLRTHPNSTHPYKGVHAEFSAILGISLEELRGCDAYVYRQTKNGRAALSKPCLYCQMALKEAGIKNVYFTIDNEQGYDYINLWRD